VIPRVWRFANQRPRRQLLQAGRPRRESPLAASIASRHFPAGPRPMAMPDLVCAFNDATEVGGIVDCPYGCPAIGNSVSPSRTATCSS